MGSGGAERAFFNSIFFIIRYFCRLSGRMKKLGRKEFIALLPLVGGVVVVWLWDRGLKRNKQLHEKRLRVRYSSSEGPYIVKDQVIFTKTDDRVRAFDSRCTHLSCRLNLYPDGRILCPCHGSEFNSRGQVIRGPAKRSLAELPVNYDNTRKEYYAEIIMEE
jgi:cytochrome b6-f complex iron-sulfur subunit